MPIALPGTAHTTHDVIANRLLRKLREPAPDGRYNPPSWEQVYTADRTISGLLLVELKRGFTPCRDGTTFPVTKAMVEKTLGDVEVQVVRTPLPKAGGCTSSCSRPTKRSAPESNSNPPAKRQRGGRGKAGTGGSMTGALQQLLQRMAALERQASQDGSSKGRVKGGRRQTAASTMPAALKTKGTDHMPGGSRICYGYNLGTCHASGNRCDRGEHACCVSGCFSREHSYRNCPKLQTSR